MSLSEFPPHWLLTFFVLGWLLGWVALRNWSLAAWCGLTGMVVQALTASSNSWFSRLFPVSSWSASGIGLLVGLALLWGVSRLPNLWMRLLLACLLTPVVLKLALSFGGMAFMVIFQIP